jgi:hypothetical protein
MPLYVGLDVSQKETEICVVDEEGRHIWRGRCPSRQDSITQALQRHAPEPARVGMETGHWPSGAVAQPACSGRPGRLSPRQARRCGALAALNVLKGTVIG